jgi:hypothetical protein
MDLGPVQILVIALESDRLEGRALEEIRRLREADAVRLVDLLFVARGDLGEIAEIEVGSSRDEQLAERGRIAAALLGLGAAPEADDVALDQARVWYLADEIPPGTAAAIVLLEHRWATSLRDAILEVGGVTLVDSWIHPRDLTAAGGGKPRAQ